DALAAMRGRHPRIPFILVTGTQTEEIAVDCIQQGADDYVLKERLARLPSAVQRALRNRRTEIEREAAVAALRRSEEQYRLITDNTHDLICLLDPHGTVLYVSPSCKDLLGWTADDVAARGDLWRLPPGAPPAGIAVLRNTCHGRVEAAELEARDVH